MDLSPHEESVKRAAKNLLDNQDFILLMSELEAQGTATLTQGTPEAAPDNLRNLRAVQVMKIAVENLSKDVET